MAALVLVAEGLYSSPPIGTVSNYPGARKKIDGLKFRVEF
jgi:hypothetical protein